MKHPLLILSAGLALVYLAGELGIAVAAGDLGTVATLILIMLLIMALAI